MQTLRTQFAVRPARETLRTLDVDAFDCLPDGVLIVRRGRVAWASLRAAELFGTSRDALSGLPLEAIFVRADLPRLDALLALCAGKGTAPGLARMRVRETSDRAPRVLDVRATAAGGSLLPAAILSLRDASALGRTERLVRELSTSAASTDGADPDALLAAAEPIFATLHWSGAYWETTPGGAKLVRLLAPRTRGAAWDYARQILGEVVPFDRVPVLANVVASGRGEFLDDAHLVAGAAVHRRDGSDLESVEVARSLAESGLTRGAWVPVRRGRTVSHVLTVLGADMTERDLVAVQLLGDQIAAASAQRELRNTLLEEERLATTGRIAADVVRELRDPLTALVFAAGLLSRSESGHEELRSAVATVREQTDKLAHVAEGLLDLARPLAPRLEEIRLSGILVRAVAEASESRPDVDLELETAADLPRVRADATLLRHTMRLLLADRLAHLGTDARVTVRAGRAGAGVRIAVESDGPPLGGVCLAVARRTAAEMGGRLEVDSVDGRTSSRVWLQPVGVGEPGTA